MNYKVSTKEELEKFVCENWNAINTYIDQEQSKLPQPLTSSVDVRESKYKFAPVDHNMYPAGFNNLCNKDLLNCSTHFRKVFDKIKPGMNQVAIIPESHTKNKFYLDHLSKLSDAVSMSESVVTLISPDPELFADGSEVIELESQSGHHLKIYKTQLVDGAFYVFQKPELKFDAIVLNNDQSNPLPVEWKAVQTPVLPTPFVGWYRRQKIMHFEHYERVANRFCEYFSINPDLIQAKFTSMDNLNFNTKEGLDQLADKVEEFFKSLHPEANVFVKASQGTYGMGISVVSNAEEIRNMNRKVRNKMDVGKNNLKFTSVLIQEGVETILKYDDAPAEVTIYLVNGISCGGFMRMNPLKTSQGNLNAQGMLYRKFCISDVKQNNDYQIKEAVYSIIARLSTLGASYEMKQLLETV